MIFNSGKKIFFLKRPQKHQLLREDGYIGLYSNILFTKRYRAEE